MRLRTIVLIVVAAALCGCWGLLHAQKPFQEYDTVEGHAESAIPPDAYVPHEWTRARLMYPDYAGFLLGFAAVEVGPSIIRVPTGICFRCETPHPDRQPLGGTIGRAR